MQAKFKAIVDEFLSSLGLEPTAGVAQFVISDIDMTVREDAYGRHLVVEASVGALASEPGRRARQIDEILRLHLGSILDHHAVVGLAPDDRTRIVVQASVAPGLDSGERLKTAVEDVATLATRYSSVLKPQSMPFAAVAQSRPDATFDTAMIFRP